ncbi:hypothetical protein BGZ82_003818, partial [Podila clonocystis]
MPKFVEMGMPMLIQGHDKILKADDVLSFQKIPTPEALRRALNLSHSDKMIVRFGNENRAFDREALARMSNIGNTRLFAQKLKDAGQWVKTKVAPWNSELAD